MGQQREYLSTDVTVESNISGFCEKLIRNKIGSWRQEQLTDPADLFAPGAGTSSSWSPPYEALKASKKGARLSSSTFSLGLSAAAPRVREAIRAKRKHSSTIPTIQHKRRRLTKSPRNKNHQEQQQQQQQQPTRYQQNPWSKLCSSEPLPPQKPHRPLTECGRPRPGPKISLLQRGRGPEAQRNVCQRTKISRSETSVERHVMPCRATWQHAKGHLRSRYYRLHMCVSTCTKMRPDSTRPAGTEAYTGARHEHIHMTYNVAAHGIQTLQHALQLAAQTVNSQQ